VDTEGGFPGGVYDGIVEAFGVAGAVEADVTAVEFVPDVQEVFLELRCALTCQIKLERVICRFRRRRRRRYGTRRLTGSDLVAETHERVLVAIIRPPPVKTRGRVRRHLETEIGEFRIG
jgi:hypothetical protein